MLGGATSALQVTGDWCWEHESDSVQILLITASAHSQPEPANRTAARLDLCLPDSAWQVCLDTRVWTVLHCWKLWWGSWQVCVQVCVCVCVECPICTLCCAVIVVGTLPTSILPDGSSVCVMCNYENIFLDGLCLCAYENVCVCVCVWTRNPRKRPEKYGEKRPRIWEFISIKTDFFFSFEDWTQANTFTETDITWGGILSALCWAVKTENPPAQIGKLQTDWLQCTGGKIRQMFQPLRLGTIILCFYYRPPPPPPPPYLTKQHFSTQWD